MQLAEDLLSSLMAQDRHFLALQLHGQESCHNYPQLTKMASRLHSACRRVAVPQ